MEKNTKLIAGLMIAILAVSALAIAPTVFAEDIDTESPVDAQRFGGWRHRRKVRHPLLRYILKNGEYAQLSGTVVVQKGPILVLATGEDTVNVILPPLWLVGGEALNRTDLFDGDPLGIGSTITIETLKANYTKETYEITAYFAYGISGDGVEAKALLPFNIEATGE
jgi:hypothetical protein